MVNSIAETFLAALSLEVDASEQFVTFKFQLADRLMQQAQKRLEDIDLERLVAIEPRRFGLPARRSARFVARP